MAELFSKYYDLLKQFAYFKTVSTDDKFSEDILACVNWLKLQFESRDFVVSLETIKAGSTNCNPIVVARKTVDPSLKTVLIYGHYDVQPAQRNDGWDSEPFVLTERNGKLFARGVVDNKGQILAHMVSVFALLDAGQLAYNVVFVIEGNEETGGSGVSDLILSKPDLFECDYVLISDGEIPYQPVMDVSYRGCANLQVTLQTATTSLHSGLYGGAIPSASEEMIRLLDSLKTADGRVLVPGFYYGDIEPTVQQIFDCNKLDVARASLFSHSGLKKHADSFSQQTAFVSMLEVSGLVAGYTGNGFSNIVPHTAMAKINVRLAGKSDPGLVTQSIIDYLKKNAPTYATLTFDVSDSAGPVFVDTSSEIHTVATQILERVYGKSVLLNYCGATIPVVSTFVNKLGVNPLMISLGNDDCNMHGANENFDIGLIKKALNFSYDFFSKSS